MTDFRFCEVQNGRRKCRSLVRNMMWSPKKKRSSPIFEGFFQPNSGDLQKKKKVFELHMLICQYHFDGPPLKPMGPLLGSLKPTKPPEAHGQPKVHGLRDHCPPCPPSRRPSLDILPILSPDLNLIPKVQCFKLFLGILDCNFFSFLRSILTAIFIKYGSKC